MKRASKMIVVMTGWTVILGAGCAAEIGGDGSERAQPVQIDASTTRGRLMGVVDASGTRSFSYDERGRTVTAARTVAGQQYTYGYQYDALNRLRQVTYPGGLAVQYGYNSGKQLETVRNAGAPVVSSIGYSVLGQPREIRHGNGVVTTTQFFPGNHRPSTLTTRQANGTLLKELAYSYDNVGNVKTVSNEDGATGAVSERSFDYDPLNRLVEARQCTRLTGDSCVPARWHSYRYDAIGNLLAHVTYPGGEPEEQILQYHSRAADGPVHGVSDDGTNRYCYDRNGNMTHVRRFAESCTSGAIATRQIRYNRHNYPTEVLNNGSTVASYEYDGDHARVRKVSGGTTTTYLGQQVRETTGTTTYATNYIDADGTRIAEIRTNVAEVPFATRSFEETGAAVEALRPPTTIPPEPSTASMRYYHGDNLGSTTLTTDGTTGAAVSSTTYEPFGRIEGTPPPVRYSYTGQEYEQDTGYYDYHARLYDPALGRFISADTIVPDYTNPQALNRYSYVYNNPLRYNDPSGHCPAGQEETSPGVCETPPTKTYVIDPGVVIEGERVTLDEAVAGMSDDQLIEFWGPSGTRMSSLTRLGFQMEYDRTRAYNRSRGTNLTPRQYSNLMDPGHDQRIRDVDNFAKGSALIVNIALMGLGGLNGTLDRTVGQIRHLTRAYTALERFLQANEGNLAILGNFKDPIFRAAMQAEGVFTLNIPQALYSRDLNDVFLSRVLNGAYEGVQLITTNPIPNSSYAWEIAKLATWGFRR